MTLFQRPRAGSHANAPVRISYPSRDERAKGRRREEAKWGSGQPAKTRRVDAAKRHKRSGKRVQKTELTQWRDQAGTLDVGGIGDLAAVVGAATLIVAIVLAYFGVAQ